MQTVIQGKNAIWIAHVFLFSKKNAHKELSVLDKTIRNCSIILLCFFSYLAGFSQDKTSNVSFGLKAGVGMSNIRHSFTDTSGSSYTFKPGVSLSAGIRLFVPLGKKVVFLPEMILVIKGANESYRNNYYDYSYNTAVNVFYIEIPLNITYKIPIRSGMFLIGGGPSPAIKYIGGIDYSPFKTFDMGLNLISCYQFPIGFSIELNYNLGLLNASTRPDANLKNSGFSVCIGYAF